MTLCRVEDSRRRCLGMHEWAEEWAEEWIGWLSRFKLILLRRISLATWPRYGRMGGRRGGWMDGQRERARGGCGFSSLVKQKIKGNNYAVFCFPGKRFFFIFMM